MFVWCVFAHATVTAASKTRFAIPMYVVIRQSKCKRHIKRIKRLTGEAYRCVSTSVNTCRQGGLT